MTNSVIQITLLEMFPLLNQEKKNLFEL